MIRITKGAFIFILYLSAIISAQANNLKINGKVVITDNTNGSATLSFNVTWDNSWRSDESSLTDVVDDSNWDAAWVFVKFRKNLISNWQHCYLSTDVAAHSAGAAKVELGTTDGKGMGVFIYRSTIGSGTCDYNVNLQMKYTEQSPAISASDVTNLAVDAFAIEMVYVPAGGYYLGDDFSANCFKPIVGGISAADDLLCMDYTYSSSLPFGCYGVAENLAKRNVIVGTNWYTDCNNVYGLGLNTDDNWWQVDFGDGNGQEIVRFGISVYNGYQPGLTAFKLLGSNDAPLDESSWDLLYQWTDVNERPYSISSDNINSYPVWIAVKLTATGNYRYYRFKFGSGYKVLFNIAMSNVDSEMNYLFVSNENSISADPKTAGAISGNGITGGTVPASYPKGCQGFYCMKYEVSQEQYVDFLNTLTYSQQLNRTDVAPNAAAGSYAFNNGLTNRNGIKVLVQGVSPGSPAIYTLDLVDDGKYNEADDGANIACGYFSSGNAMTYADWAGLRPMTELEYEKAARGSNWPVGAEYAWGNCNLTPAATFTANSEGTNAEAFTDASANIYFNAPVRSGAFCSGNNREQSGASYWGIMELSGNLAEITVPLSNNTFGFTGTHGNGNVADLPSLWPGTSYMGVRGGSYLDAQQPTRFSISDRSEAISSVISNRKPQVGFRAVRTAIPQP